MRGHPGTRWLAPGLVALVVLAGCGSSGVTSASTYPGPDASTTTTSTSTTTPAPVPMSPLPAVVDAWHFEGEHHGTEHFTTGTQRCPQLDHELVETFTVADGSAWRFTSHYCGTVDAQMMWRGEGTFTIAVGAGTGLAGTVTDSAQLPSTGEPYQLDVTSGTGDLAGATGTCRLTNHLRPVSPGVQEQSGTFVCDLRRAQ